MKKGSLLMLVLLFIGIFATSCSDDDNEGETLAPLEGKWKLSQVGTIVGETETLVDAPQNESGCDRDFMDLRISNAVIFGDYDSTVSECALSETEGVYTRSHNNLTVVVGGVSTTQDIVNLTLSELKLKDPTGIITVYKR